MFDHYLKTITSYVEGAYRQVQKRRQKIVRTFKIKSIEVTGCPTVEKMLKSADAFEKIAAIIRKVVR
jgi:hypothetical protein